MHDSTVAELLADAREVYGVFGKAEKALGIVDRALTSEPNNVVALNLKAAILYDLDRDNEAVACHRHALEIDPCSVEALHGLAALANDHGHYADAIKLVDQGFAALPNDTDPEMQENEDFRQRVLAELFNEKAFALWYTGRKLEAEKYLTVDAPAMCPLEVETFEEELEWLEEHPDSPED